MVIFLIGFWFWLASSSNATEEIALPAVEVKGSATEATYLDSLPSVSRISGKKLDRARKETLGETLSGEAGISSSFFGPNSSRPVIRGLDGDRIRILENGVGTFDASAASPDHAVSVDPLVIDEIEVIRGPSALLYGNNAIGGVVNMRTARIATRLLDQSEYRASSSVQSINRGISLGALTKIAGKKWVWEFDAVGRQAQDYQAPNGLQQNQTVQNSAQKVGQLGLGGTYFGDSSRTGFALSGMQTVYGVVAEPDVEIDLKRFRLDFEHEQKTRGWFETIRVKGSANIYQHEELEDEVVATTFKNRGGELRVDLKHRKSANSEGVFGFQSQYFDFSVQGAEAFLPSTQNQSYGLFGFEEWDWGSFKTSVGLRGDAALVRSVADDRFGPAQSKSFLLPSGSAGISIPLTAVSQTGLNFTYTERAPNYQELFANGAHIATGVFEVGNPALNPEKSFGTEWFWRIKTAQHQLRVATFAQSFSSFIALRPTGANDVDSGLGIQNFESVSALLAGAEIEWNYLLPEKILDGDLETDLKFDFVRGRDRTNDGNLPRITPIRQGFEVRYRKSGWTGWIQQQRSFEQIFASTNESITAGFDLINLGIEAPISTDWGAFRLGFRIQNALNAEARMHNSIIKNVAPLPGRNFLLSVQAAI